MKTDVRCVVVLLLIVAGCTVRKEPITQFPQDVPIRRLRLSSKGSVRNDRVRAQQLRRQPDPSAEYRIFQGDEDGVFYLSQGWKGEIKKIWNLGRVSDVEVERAKPTDPFGDDVVVTWKEGDKGVTLGVPSFQAVIAPAPVKKGA